MAPSQSSTDPTACQSRSAGRPDTLVEAAVAVLATASAERKAALSRAAAEAWRRGRIARVRARPPAPPPARPARPARPELRPPREMPRRRDGKGSAARVALLHALAHIELNAIDLAWDLIARFAHEDLPRAFFDDWTGVAADEARHFQIISERLKDFGAAYGCLPAHDGLWQAAADTSDDILARLAIVPLVLEARGLDVTPEMIRRLRSFGDDASADMLETILADEIAHVAAGSRWFEHVCRARGLAPEATWQALVRGRFKGELKPPFNHDARAAAGLPRGFYAPFA